MSHPQIALELIRNHRAELDRAGRRAAVLASEPAPAPGRGFGAAGARHALAGMLAATKTAATLRPWVQ
jgi:hypothetical protein